jgi:hypothetical protein
MDEATIASGVNQALTEASGSIHFRERLNELGDTLVLEYHFTHLPERIDLMRLTAALDKVQGLVWSEHHGESRLILDGVVGDKRVTVFISLRKEASAHP